MADYNPMQYSLARANVIGNTASGIGSSIIDFGNKMAAIAKQKDVQNRIDNAYRTAINTYVQRAKEVDPDTKEDKARLMAVRFIQKPPTGMSAENSMKLLIDSSIRADTYLDKLEGENKVKAEKQKMATAAQSAVSGGREYSLERDTGQGFTEQDVTEKTPPAQYQEEAMSAYGQMAAEGNAPVQTAKELENQPSIAALPKTPEPEKPMTAYQQASLKLQEERNKIAKMREAKDNTDDLDKNLRWAQDRQDDISANEITYSEKVAKLRQIKVKTKAGKKLSDDMVKFLAGENMNAVSPDMNELDNAINNYQNLLNEVEDLKAEADETVKALTETKSLSRSITRGKDKKAGSVKTREDAAINYVRQKIIPTLSVFSSSLKTVLDKTPTEHKSVLEKKINEARASGLNDDDILKMLSSKSR